MNKPELRPVRVLFVEDSEDDVRLALRALRAGGFRAEHARVQTAGDFAAALIDGGWDAVLSDYSMPGFNGLEALRLFRASGSDIPFLLVSGTIGEEFAADAMKAGASDYVMKGNLARLAPALERELKEAGSRAELRRAHEALAESERRFSAMLANVQLASVMLDREGHITYCNDYLLKLSGWRLAEVIGKDWFETFMPAVLGDMKPMFAALLENRPEAWNRDNEILTRSGERRMIRWNHSVLKNGPGEVIGTASIGEDITERMKALEDLRASELRFRSLTDLSSDWYWEQDEQFRFVTFSGGDHHRGWGDDQLGLAGLCRWELPGVTPIEGGWDEHRALLAAHQPFRNLEYRRTLADGTIRYVSASGEPVFDAAARFTGYRGVATDITERKRDYEALRRFSSAMDATADALYLVDRASMKFVHVNEAACRMQGKTREELLALGPEGVLSTRRGDLEGIYDAMIASGLPAEPVEMLRTRADGSKAWVELRRHAQPSADGWTIVTVVRDITRQRASDDSVRRFRTAMEVSGDGILLIDRATMRYIDVNQTLCDLTGRTREEMIGLTPMDVFSADRAMLERDYDALIADSGCSSNLVEGHYRRKDGSQVPIETHRRALNTESGWIIIGTARDITRRKAAEARIQYLNRVYSVLSGINTLIVRAGDRDEVFREACRIAVDDGGFRVAWIGMVDDAAAKLVLAASAGEDEALLRTLKDRYSPAAAPPRADSLTGRAIREKTVIVSNDSQNDPQVLFSRQHVAAGIRSMALFPLVVGDQAVGVLALYSGEVEFFHAEELKLLTELAGDIAFAIDHIEKRERLQYLAYYDVLTGLANRSLFLERVAQFMRSAAEGRHQLAVFFIDVERFKNINDSLGRPAGDALLKQVAEWLTAGGGDPALACRVGADHFAMVMPRVKSEADVVRFLENRINAFVEHKFSLNDTDYRIAIKVGVAIYPENGPDADALLRNAEAALKKAKERGERHVFYKQKMTEAGAGKLSLENKLRTALEKEEFVLHYQPKINLQDGRLTGAEALIRWNDPETGLVPPGRFIPVLEETGLIHEVGRWAMHRAIGDYLRWRAAGLRAVRMAVNVSPLQLRGRGFVAEVEKAIGVDAAAGAGLELEITESLIMEDVRHSIDALKAIRDHGVTIAIDDFGTGFSSLAYLAKLPVDSLKIDRSFVVEMTAGPDGLALVSTIINLAHSLKLKVVAEGVETEEQKRLLRLLSCDEMQGFLFSRPVPAAEFEAKFLAPPAG